MFSTVLRFYIVFTFCVFSAISAGFAHDVGPVIMSHKGGEGTLSSHGDETSGNTRYLPAHVHSYTFPNGGPTWHIWHYVTGTHTHADGTSHDHGKVFQKHRHGSVPERGNQGNPPPQTPPVTVPEHGNPGGIQDLLDNSEPEGDTPPSSGSVPGAENPQQGDPPSVRQPAQGNPEHGNPSTGNHLSENQPTVNQPTVNQPTTRPVVSATPTSETAPQGRPQEPQPASNDTTITPITSNLRITEYMVRDWTAGIGGLPQWIEVYNPNTETVNLKGWTLQYATRRSANAPHKVHTLMLAGTQDGFSIAGGGVAILSTRHLPAWRFSGIEATQVYNLNIDNVLKRGWVLTDADGAEIHRLGRAAFGALGDPVAPLHQNQARVSHQVVPSESPPEVYYYGHREDMGSPGFYEQPAPSAPSAVKRKRVGTWASLKQTP